MSLPCNKEPWPARCCEDHAPAGFFTEAVYSGCFAQTFRCGHQPAIQKKPKFCHDGGVGSEQSGCKMQPKRGRAASCWGGLGRSLLDTCADMLGNAPPGRLQGGGFRSINPWVVVSDQSTHGQWGQVGADNHCASLWRCSQLLTSQSRDH